MRYIPYLKDIIEKPNEIWLTPIKHNKMEISFRKRYIPPLSTSDKKTSLVLILDIQNGIFVGYDFYNRDIKKLIH